MNSCIYQGTVCHQRQTPRKHSFEYSMYMLMLDLSELNSVFRRRLFWSHRFPTFYWFRRKDHIGPATEPLDVTVRSFVEKQTGHYPTGRICLLTNLRQLGFQMNPVSFFYIYDATSNCLSHVVAEVHNTPWGETHCYLIPPEMWEPGDPTRPSTKKSFHVSPFMEMDQRYTWSIEPPGPRLMTKMDVRNQESEFFNVSMMMQRRPLTTLNLCKMSIRFPWMTMRIFLGIYLQALRLWIKKIPFHPHPAKKVPHSKHSPDTRR